MHTPGACTWAGPEVSKGDQGKLVQDHVDGVKMATS